MSKEAITVTHPDKSIHEVGFDDAGAWRTAQYRTIGRVLAVWSSWGSRSIPISPTEDLEARACELLREMIRQGRHGDRARVLDGQLATHTGRRTKHVEFG